MQPARLLIASMMIAGTAPSIASAVDREELGKVIRSIPRNGPFEEYGNVILRMRSKKAGMSPAVFPHWSHRTRYTCRVCHLELEFALRRGASGISRDRNRNGRFCGSCHDGKTAFTVQEEGKHCDRCHMKSAEALRPKFEEFASSMPTASYGNGIDWAKALNSGAIIPKKTVLAVPPPLHLPENLKKPLKLGTTSPRSDVTFSHEEHFEELDCSNCHPDVFNIKKKGTQAFTMDRNIFGEFCGTCHMRTAFPMNDCKRCHPQMKGNYSF